MKDKTKSVDPQSLSGNAQNAQSQTGTLYVVATPIGNLGDISERMCQTLAEVARIAAEDTRRTRQLLSHIGVDTPCFSLHDHNERQKVDGIVQQLLAGESLALVSDAGTPLISDPGYPLVSAVRAAGIRVVPVPGPSALITALCAAGLPSDRFRFEGFLSAKANARQKQLQALSNETATLIFYESSHRIRACLQDIADIFGQERRCVIARELTKTFETFLDADAATLVTMLDEDANQSKGEFVVMCQGAQKKKEHLSEEACQLAVKLSEYLPGKQVAKIVAELYDEKKNKIYQYLLDREK